jgi:hypothetical protein
VEPCATAGWHTSSQLPRVSAVAFAFVSALLDGCGGSTGASADHRDIDTRAPDTGSDATRDAGPDNAVPDSGVIPDAEAGVPDARPFAPTDPAPCGSGTAWEQIAAGIVAEYEKRLDAIVGGFTAGTKGIYDGTASISDNMGVVYVSNGRLTGPVRLLLEPTSDGQDVLILPPARDKYVRLQQLTANPSVTLIFQVHEWNVESGGYFGNAAKIPAFAAPPAGFDFTVHAEGQELSPGVPFAIDVDLHATRIAPEALTFRDIVSTTRFDELADFAQRSPSSDFVRHVSDGIGFPSCVPAGIGFAPGECSYHATFTLDLVITSDLSKRGVEQLSIGDSSLVCYHCDRYEGAGEIRRCLAGERSKVYP